jgi:hypothetical protein
VTGWPIVDQVVLESIELQTAAELHTPAPPPADVDVDVDVDRELVVLISEGAS